MKLTHLIIAVLLFIPCVALAIDDDITIYNTEAEILKHNNENTVTVGVKVSVGNSGPTKSVHALVKGVDSSGYEVASIRVKGIIRSQDSGTLTGTGWMNKMTYLKTDRWEVVDLYTR